MVADVEVTRLPSDRSGRSFMVLAPPEKRTDRDNCDGSRIMPLHRRVVRQRRVLYFFLRDGDLTTAVGKLERLGRLLKDGTSPFMAAGMACRFSWSMRFGMLRGSQLKSTCLRQHSRLPTNAVWAILSTHVCTSAGFDASAAQATQAWLATLPGSEQGSAEEVRLTAIVVLDTRMTAPVQLPQHART